MAYEINFPGTPSYVPNEGFGLALGAGFGDVQNYPLPSDQDGFTIVCRPKTNSPAGYQVALNVASMCRFHVTPDGYAECFVLPNEYKLTGPTVGQISDNKPHHLAMTYSVAAGATFFVDGVNVASRQSQFMNAAAPSQYTTSINFMSFGGGGYPWGGSLDEVAIYKGIKYTNNFTPSTAPIPVGDSGLVTVWRFDGNALANTPVVTSSTADMTLYQPDNAAILYSPYNWLVNGTVAKTINPGAYFSTLFAGGYCKLKFDTSNGSSQTSTVSIRIDSGAWRRYAVTDIITPEIDTTYSGTQPWHLLEVVFDSHSEGAARWSPQGTAIQFVGLLVQKDTALRAVVPLARKVLVYGTSITEGRYTLSNAGTNDVLQNQARIGWAFSMRQALGAEVGCVGFSSQGLSNGGMGGVPPFSTTYKLLWDGQPRVFSPEPNLILIEQGANDGGSDMAPVYTTILNDLLSLTTKTLIVPMQPFGGQHASDIQNAVNNTGSSRVKFMSTVGFWQAQDAPDGLHPWGYSDVNLIAPNVANAAQLLLAGAGATATPAIPTGSIPPGKTLFKYVGTGASLSSYPNLSIVRELADGGEWASGTPGGPSFQPVNQFVTGRKYYVFNSSSSPVSLLGAQL
jgi:hypothetical protein